MVVGLLPLRSVRVVGFVTRWWDMMFSISGLPVKEKIKTINISICPLDRVLVRRYTGVNFKARDHDGWNGAKLEVSLLNKSCNNHTIKRHIILFGWIIASFCHIYLLSNVLIHIIMIVLLYNTIKYKCHWLENDITRRACIRRPILMCIGLPEYSWCYLF